MGFTYRVGPKERHIYPTLGLYYFKLNDNTVKDAFPIRIDSLDDLVNF